MARSYLHSFTIKEDWFRFLNEHTRSRFTTSLAKLGDGWASITTASSQAATSGTREASWTQAQPSPHHLAGAAAPLVSCQRGFAPSLNTANFAKSVLGSCTTVMHMASSNDGLWWIPLSLTPISAPQQFCRRSAGPKASTRLHLS